MKLAKIAAVLLLSISVFGVSSAQADDKKAEFTPPPSEPTPTRTDGSGAGSR